jgi:hypothetical protein
VLEHAVVVGTVFATTFGAPRNPCQGPNGPEWEAHAAANPIWCGPSLLEAWDRAVAAAVVAGVARLPVTEACSYVPRPSH